MTPPLTSGAVGSPCSSTDGGHDVNTTLSDELISPDDSLAATCEQISGIQRHLTRLFDQQRKTSANLAAVATVGMFDAMQYNVQRSIFKHEQSE